jgi:hypothetical protein
MSRTLRKRNRGPDVQRWQATFLVKQAFARSRRRSFFDKTFDKTSDEATAAATRQFQRDDHLRTSHDRPTEDARGGGWTRPEGARTLAQRPADATPSTEARRMLARHHADRSERREAFDVDGVHDIGAARSALTRRVGR